MATAIGLRRGADLRPTVVVVSKRAMSSVGLTASMERARAGMGGRSSVSGVVATVFGAYGFLGKYVVNRLGRTGTQIVAPYRGDIYEARDLKVLGDLGQIVLVHYDANNREEIMRTMEHSNVVINLTGKRKETYFSTFDSANHQLSKTIAECATEVGCIERFIHVSSLSAVEGAQSKWSQSKLAGENAVREAFPSATVLRLGPLVGEEDKFMNRFAVMAKTLNRVPLFGRQDAKFQPIFVGDVSRAISNTVFNPRTRGKDYDLAAPESFTLREIVDFVIETMRHPEAKVLPLPPVLGQIGNRILEKSPIFPRFALTEDEVTEYQEDHVCRPGSKGARDLGVDPELISVKAVDFLRRFRTGSHFLDVPQDHIKIRP